MSTFVQIKRKKKTRWGAVDLGGMRSRRVVVVVEVGVGDYRHLL